MAEDGPRQSGGWRLTFLPGALAVLACLLALVAGQYRHDRDDASGREDVAPMQGESAPKVFPELATGCWAQSRGTPGLTGEADGSLMNPVLRWRVSLGTGFDDGIVSSPVMGWGRVYVATRGGEVYCLQAADGAVVWKVKPGVAVEAGLFLTENRLIVGDVNGSIFSLNVHDGAICWMFSTDAKIAAAATALDQATVLASSHDGKLYALAADDGALRWAYETESYVNGTAAVDGAWIVVGGCDQNVHVLDKAGALSFKVDLGSYIAACVAVSGGAAYAGQYEGVCRRLDLSSGRIAWEYRASSPVMVSAALDGERVFFATQSGNVFALTRDTGEEVWASSLGEAVAASPVTWGGMCLAVTRSGRVALLDTTTGNTRWRTELGAVVSATPAAGGNLLVLAAESGDVFAFGPGKGD